MLCVTGKWLLSAAKVRSIECFKCALNDPIYFDVDGKLKIQFASVTVFFLSMQSHNDCMMENYQISQIT